MKNSLIDILRKTLVRLEDSSQIRQDDPALTEVKTKLLLAIAELELRRAGDFDSNRRAFAS